MEIITGYAGKKHVTSEQDRDVNQGIAGPGSYVLVTGMQLEAEVSSNNEIKIRDGVLMHQGCAASIKKNTYDSLTIINGSQGMKRIDLVVARYEKNQDDGTESLELKVLQGTPVESNPAIPDYTEGDIQAGDSVADMPLYQVIIDGLNITEVKKVFEVIETNKGLKTKIDNIFSPTLTTEGLSAREGRCTIEDGGYCMIGNMCFFQMRIKMAVSLSGPNYWTLLDNLPRSQNGSSVACTITGIGNDTVAKTLSLEANSPDVAGSNLVIHNAATISVGTIFCCSGFYLI